jgi:hypothetical protein
MTKYPGAQPADMKPATESSADTIIRDLRRIREEIVDSFNGDLQQLTEDARRRQEASGRTIWRRGEAQVDSASKVPEPDRDG